ncbi:MAG: hypothetical protein KGL95_10995 [Patescibacteria group bacterium]|nr:hypothetical protein [Patescibacteria group bacterium]
MLENFSLQLPDLSSLPILLILVVVTLFVTIILYVIFKNREVESSYGREKEHDALSLNEISEKKEESNQLRSEEKPKKDTFDPHPMGGKTHD